MSWYPHIFERSCLGALAVTTVGAGGALQSVNWIGLANGVVVFGSTIALGATTIYLLVRGRLDAAQRESESVARHDRHEWEVRERGDKVAWEQEALKKRAEFEAANRDSLTEQLKRAEADRVELKTRIAEMTESVNVGRESNNRAIDRANVLSNEVQVKVGELRSDLRSVTEQLARSEAHVVVLTAEVASLTAEVTRLTGLAVETNQIVAANLAGSVIYPSPTQDATPGTSTAVLAKALDKNTVSTDLNTEAAAFRDARDHPPVVPKGDTP